MIIISESECADIVKTLHRVRERILANYMRIGRKRWRASEKAMARAQLAAEEEAVLQAMNVLRGIAVIEGARRGEGVTAR